MIQMMNVDASAVPKLTAFTGGHPPDHFVVTWCILERLLLGQLQAWQETHPGSSLAPSHRSSSSVAFPKLRVHWSGAEAEHLLDHCLDTSGPGLSCCGRSNSLFMGATDEGPGVRHLRCMVSWRQTEAYMRMHASAGDLMRLLRAQLFHEEATISHCRLVHVGKNSHLPRSIQLECMDLFSSAAFPSLHLLGILLHC